MRTRILPYSPASKSAAIIADLVDGKRIRLDNSAYEWEPGDLVINWGNGYRQGYPGQLNSPTAVANAVNKVSFFKTLQARGVPEKYYPRFWTPEDDTGFSACVPVIVRITVEGARGEGAVYVNANTPFPDDWKLCTVFMQKTREYRLHLGRRPGGAVDVLSSLKLLRYNEYEPNPIQNHANGYFHSKIDYMDVPKGVIDAALEVFPALGLDFCALDIGYNEETREAQVFEANTAPAIEHQHVKDGYREFFSLFTQGN